jgi:hypothetical protein
MENGKIFQEEWGVSRNTSSLMALTVKYGYIPVLALAITMLVLEFNIGQFEDSSRVLHPWFTATLRLSFVMATLSIFVAIVARSKLQKVFYVFCLLLCAGVGLLSYVNLWFDG